MSRQENILFYVLDTMPVLVFVCNERFESDAMFFFKKNSFLKKSFFKFSCVFLSLEKLVNKKHFPVKEKFGLVSRKVFS